MEELDSVKKHIATVKIWQKANPEKVKEYKRRYRIAHKDEVNKYNRDRRVRLNGGIRRPRGRPRKVGEQLEREVRAILE